MADIKISELGAALTVGDSDVLPMTASGVTSKVSTSLLKDYVIGTTDISAIGDGTVTGAIDAINTDMPDGLDDLDDVSITTPADGEAPVYDSVSQKFKNTAIVTQDEFGDVIAPIEVSPSAHAYSVGKQLLYNNVLYTVTSPIAVSDALTEGTNITASDTVIEQVEDNTSDISDLHDEFYDAWKKNGAYNLCPNEASTTVDNGVTYTVNADGTITATTASDTHNFSALALFTGTWIPNTLPAKKLKLVGCPSGGGNGVYCIGVQFNTIQGEGGTGLESFNDYGNGVEITATAAAKPYVKVTIVVWANVPMDNKVFKPMITTNLNATYADFVPYAKTNRELTNTLKSLFLPTYIANGVTYTGNCNDLEPGLVYVGSGATNSPGNYYLVFTFSVDLHEGKITGYGTQIAIGITTHNIKTRICNTGTWSAWKTITPT